MDYFAILGLPRTATASQAKATWREKMRVYHPDRLANAPREVRLAAEDTAKLLNHAYDCVLKALETGNGRVQPVGTRSASPKSIPTAHELLSRTRAAFDHGNGMVDRWRISSRGFRKARQSLLDSAETIDERMSSLSATRIRLQNRWGHLAELAESELNARLIAPIESYLHDASAALARAEHLQSGKTQEQGRKTVRLECHRARSAFEAAEAGPFSDPMALASAISDVQVRLQRAIEQFQHLMTEMGSVRRDCVSASDRLRPQYRSLRKRYQEMIQDDESISDAVQRAEIAVATLVALARNESTAARGEDAVWRSKRMLEESEELNSATAHLVAEWADRHHAADLMNRWLHEFRDRTARDRLEIAKLSEALVHLEKECIDLEGGATRACHEALRAIEKEWLSRRDELLVRLDRLAP